MKRTRIAIIGATTAGIGAAAARGNDAILFEKGMLAGTEFGAAMYAAPYSGNKEEPLFQEFLDAGGMDREGRLHPSSLSPFLMQKLKNSGAEARLFTRVLEINRCSEGFVISYFDTEGLHACIAEQVLLTTHDGRPASAAKQNWKKYLCAQLCCPSGKEIRSEQGDGWQIIHGTLKHERIFRVSVPGEAEWPEARRRLHEAWKTAYAGPLAGWNIAAVASSFAYVYERPECRKTAEGIFCLPSASYGNMVDAYNGGAACAISIG